MSEEVKNLKSELARYKAFVKVLYGGLSEDVKVLVRRSCKTKADRQLMKDILGE